MATFDPAAIESHPARQFTLRNLEPPRLTIGDRLSDRIAAIVGSWRFIIIQSTILVGWIALNVLGWMQHWDPYPFILLNLALSFQAAFTAPILMMAQNRQAVIDRQKAQLDYDVNLRAELDIEALHQKLDLLREEDIGRLIRLLELLTRERLGDETRTQPTTEPG